MEQNTHDQIEAQAGPSATCDPSPTSAIEKGKGDDYLEKVYPGCLYDAEREGEERRAALKEKKRRRRQRYKANCKARGKPVRKNTNWSIAKEILNTNAGGTINDADNLAEFAAYLETNPYHVPLAPPRVYSDDEDWEVDPPSKQEFAYRGERQEAAPEPLPDSDDELAQRELAEFFADVPPECLPDIPANAPPSPPITAADFNATLERARVVCEKDPAAPDLPDESLFTSEEEGKDTVVCGGREGEEEKSDQNNDVELPCLAEAARFKAAPQHDVISGTETSDRNGRSMVGGLVGERPLAPSPSALSRGRN